MNVKIFMDSKRVVFFCESSAAQSLIISFWLRGGLMEVLTLRFMHDRRQVCIEGGDNHLY